MKRSSFLHIDRILTMGHGVEGRSTPPAQLDADSAASVAATLQALATPSRLRILTRLRHGPCSVSELSDAVEMEQSAVSHQLRLLRNLGLVTGIRKGRTVVYSLYDSHVALLLDEAVYHIEHVGGGITDDPAVTA
jgi:ArsR family transcriptional regulator, nickel/cobalt-responsive transcriptional repressor